jgi:hypothetical protein
MTSLELLEKIKTALADDEYLSAWCQEIFEKDHSVFIDIDEQNPPVPDTDYPIIVVTSLSQTRGDSVRELTWDLELGVGLVQEEIVTDGNTTVMSGFGQVEYLRELAENALYRAGLGDVTTRGESGSVSHYPLFISGSVVPIKTLKSNRRAMPV